MPPRVSILMANRNGARFLRDAIESVRRQTLADWTLIAADDGSDDDSLAILAAFARSEPRIRLVPAPIASTGPAAARNRALAAAEGEFIAILDSDDYLHPERLEKMLATAERHDADIVVDDLLTFYEGRAQRPHAHLPERAAKPRTISLAELFETNRIFESNAATGYLKPLIRRRPGLESALRYDESLTIGEDFDLLARLLAAGAVMRLLPEPLYFYRKHARSISHRLNPQALTALHAASRNYRHAPAPLNRAQSRALGRYQSALERALAFTRSIEALKNRDIKAAVAVLLRRPDALALYRMPVIGRLARFGPARGAPRKGRPAPPIAVLSRQRLTDGANGSSAYLLGIAARLRSRGLRSRLLGTSPALFGRTPWLRLGPALAAFEDVEIAGGWRLGPWVFAREPAIWRHAVKGAIARVAARFGLDRMGWFRGWFRGWDEKRPWAIAAPAARAEQVFVARSIAGEASAILCDYAFLIRLAPFALAPAAPRFILMHDLFSARTKAAGAGADLAWAAANEFACFAQADLTLAIQSGEAERLAAAGLKVALLPHGVDPLDAPSPGEDEQFLFVGGYSPPNVEGLKWLVEAVWPSLRAVRPGARLVIAGAVERARADIAPQPVPGLDWRGVVPDLAPLYAEAGTVLAPLQSGSGLKIKVVEAMAAGKAIVATPIAAQGLEPSCAEALLLASDASAFAAAMARAAADRSLRLSLGQNALEIVRRRFSTETACRELFDRLADYGVAALQNGEY